MKNKNLDIILPCYNPLKDWHKSIVNSYCILENELLDTNIFIILVNDGSTIEIKEAEIAYLENKIPNFQFISYDINMGKGYALRKGFRKSKSKFAIFTDIDFPYVEENLIAMYQKLEEGADLVLGNRNQDYYKKVPFLRKIISISFKNSLKFLFQIPTSDTQAGLKGFSNKGKAFLLKTTTNRYLFDLELIKLASKDKQTVFDYITLRLKDDIVLSKLSLTILLKEFKNLLKILFL